MKMIAEYLGRAHQFERLSSAASHDQELQRGLESQAEAYRELAAECAIELGVTLPLNEPKRSVHGQLILKKTTAARKLIASQKMPR
jgi:hypothetical protein